MLPTTEVSRLRRLLRRVPNVLPVAEIRLHRAQTGITLPIYDVKLSWTGSRNGSGTMYETMDEFLLFYKKLIFSGWSNFGPQEYVTTLISVGLIGWYLMRRGASM